MTQDKDKWNEHYRVAKDAAGTDGCHKGIPSRVLSENSHLLPRYGTALDLACGLGANALLLAKHGLTAHAWDISNIAVSELQQKIAKLSIDVTTQVRDVVTSPPPKNSFDVIVVSRFLDRGITGSLIDALKPGGFIYYQTFVIDKNPDCGPKNLDYLLKRNELLQMFQELVLRVYREEGHEGDTDCGFRNEALLVAQKTSFK